MVTIDNQRVNAESPPSRGRGLKLRAVFWWRSMRMVAPLAGAWIETALYSNCRKNSLRRPPRGGVD